MSNPHSHSHLKNDHRRSNTLPSRPLTTSTANRRTFDISLIIRNREISSASTTKNKTPSPPKQNTEKQKKRERSNTISHPTTTAPTAPRRFPTLKSGVMPHKLLKRQKGTLLVEQEKDHGNLHQTPTSSTTLPPSSDTPRRVPSQIHRLQNHRRSRSFSELLNSLSSISGKPQQLTAQDQPWRSGEAWLALHSQRLQFQQHERASEMPPIQLQTSGAWRQRSRAELFGTDMSVPLPSYRSVRKAGVSLEDKIPNPMDGKVDSNINPSLPAKQLATHLGTLGPALTIHTSPLSVSRERQLSNSPSSTTTSSESRSPSGSILTTWQTPPQYIAVDDDNNDDLLPPLLPPRREPGSPSSLGSSPPWAQSGSGRASPNASLRLRTPTSPHPFPFTRSGSVPSPSPLGSSAQKVRHSSPSRNATTINLDSVPPLPHTPPRGAMRPQTPRRSTSPRFAVARQEDKVDGHQEMPKLHSQIQPQTPQSQSRSSKKFWRRKARVTTT